MSEFDGDSVDNNNVDEEYEPTPEALASIEAEEIDLLDDDDLFDDPDLEVYPNNVDLALQESRERFEC